VHGIVAKEKLACWCYAVERWDDGFGCIFARKAGACSRVPRIEYYGRDLICLKLVSVTVAGTYYFTSSILCRIGRGVLIWCRHGVNRMSQNGLVDSGKLTESNRLSLKVLFRDSLIFIGCRWRLEKG
jgi:hypothetical protein